MSTQARRRGAPKAVESVNQVTLTGRLSGDVEERVLPSGDTLRSLRIVVERQGAVRERSRQTVDTIDCVVWRGRIKQGVGSWRPGDVVSVSGALRRRFFQTPGGAASRVEVEVTGGRLIRRAAT